MMSLNPFPKTFQEVVGLIPAGGLGTRISPLPCSKELYPVGFMRHGNTDEIRPKVVCEYLLEKMKFANIKKIYLVLRKGKWDIPSYLGDGSSLNINLAYLLMNHPYGAPFTVDQAYPFVKDSLVALGFPDIIFKPKDAFAKLIEKQSKSGADIVLGLFETDQPQHADMVKFDQAGRVYDILIKPKSTDLTFAWIIAVWTPVFTEFMHECLKQMLNEKRERDEILKIDRELFVGDIINKAIADNLSIQSLVFENKKFLDIGIPSNLINAISKIVTKI
ncbi:MAG: sugar phosphate nucleotidyltransferase [Thermodesulfobacteriota bacterium]